MKSPTMYFRTNIPTNYWCLANDTWYVYAIDWTSGKMFWMDALTAPPSDMTILSLLDTVLLFDELQQ